LAQGDKHTNTQGTHSIFILSHAAINHIPADRVVTYANIVVDYRPQKADPNRVRITAGGNLIDYPGELTTRTADLHGEDTVEQRSQHRRSKIYGSGYWKLLLGDTVSPLRIYEIPNRALPRTHHRVIRSQTTRTQGIRIRRNTQGNLRPTPSRHIGKSTLEKTPSPGRLL
jgi:hypothetical protein